MAEVDFELLRRLLAESARRAFSKLREMRPNETFYAFALYTVDDAVVLSPSANTEEAYARVRSKYASSGKFTEAGLLGNFRWSPYDWECDCVGVEAFDPVIALINDRGVRPI
ncbi:DUF4303 domain-containing protein [Paludisphaera mucosa]|uniref:DUF4303 domain-containing protein n=1 Tax=Paludisphaera mucosa TaxID=3030827 RepID=A0ABT6F9L2_9BACT|nr:DUF4303 domain-containing protein [Paludisphaera mucosa]MDG3004284.1 DUF4303 domain-containing protein [Paludisphaera mucosa]